MRTYCLLSSQLSFLNYDDLVLQCRALLAFLYQFLICRFSFLDYDHFVLQCVAVGILRFFFPLKSQFSFLNYEHFVLQCLAVGTPRLFSQDSVLIPLLFSFRVAVSYSWYAKNIFCLVNSLLIVNRTFSSKQTFEILSTPTEAHTYRYLWM